MDDNKIKAHPLKFDLKSDIFDFIISLVSFFTVYFLSFSIINDEDYIKAALTYLVFFIAATTYIIVKKSDFRPTSILTGAVCIILDTALAIHGSLYIIPVLMAASSLYCLTLTGSNLHTSGSYLYAFDLIQRAFITPVANLFLPLRAMFLRLKSIKKSRRNFSAIAGILVAAPLLCLLFMLLMNSDAAFESITDNLLNKLRELLPRFDFDIYAFIALVFTPYIVSVLFCFRYNIDSKKGSSLRSNIKKLRIANASFLGGFLGSVCLLYAVYLLSQTAYFFSAFAGKLPDGTAITLSEYARRGFFEMSTIAAINLALIAAGAIFSKRNGESFSKIFKGISLFLCLFTMVLITTAISKMFLYINEMGLTHKRLAVSAINVVMFLSFIFIIIRLFRKSFPYFRYIAVLSVIVLTAFTVISPDTIIGSYNTYAYLSGKHQSIDIDLLNYQINTYDSIKSLYKLKDDPLYGIAAKMRLRNYYNYETKYFPSTIKGYAAKKFVANNIDEFETFYNDYTSIFDNDVSTEYAETEDFTVAPLFTEIFFCNRSTKVINEIELFDSYTSQSVLSPETGTIFSYDLREYFDGINIYTLAIHFESGYIWEEEIKLSDTNFFEITDGDDGRIYVLPLLPVNSFDEAIDVTA